jgi:hypothetical protein
MITGLGEGPGLGAGGVAGAPGSSCRSGRRTAHGVAHGLADRADAVRSQAGSALTARNAAGLQGTNSGTLVPPSDWRLGGAPCAPIT